MLINTRKMIRNMLVFVFLMVVCDEGKAASVTITKESPTSLSPTSGFTSISPSSDLTEASKTSNNNSENSRQCAPAHNTSLPAAQCHRYYNHSTGLCNESIPLNGLIYANRKQQKKHEKLLRTVRIKREFFGSLNMPNPAQLLRSQCFQMIQDMYCRYYFPLCDTTSSRPQPQAICREACELLNYDCKNEWIQLMQYYPGVTWSAQEEIGEKKEEHESLYTYQQKNILMNCEGLPRIEGPNIPECYIPYKYLLGKTAIEGGNGSTHDCFYGNGYTYRGNVSITKSGFNCQSWSEQCPHRHYRSPDQYEELVGAGNACRNPGHQAPLGPWCYTTNPKLRWEYCEIKRCENDKSQHFVSSQTQEQVQQSVGEQELNNGVKGPTIQSNTADGWSAGKQKQGHVQTPTIPNKQNTDQIVLSNEWGHKKSSKFVGRPNPKHKQRQSSTNSSQQSTHGQMLLQNGVIRNNSKSSKVEEQSFPKLNGMIQRQTNKTSQVQSQNGSSADAVPYSKRRKIKRRSLQKQRGLLQGQTPT